MNHFFIQVENTHPQIYENTIKTLKIMSRSSYRSTKKNTRTLSKIEQTILEEERREKQARSKSYQPSLSVKKQDHKKRYRKSNNHRPVIIQTKIQTQTQKREKRETTKQDYPKIRFNPKFRKMSWIEIEETPDEEYQGLWMIDSDNEEE